MRFNFSEEYRYPNLEEFLENVGTNMMEALRQKFTPNGSIEELNIALRDIDDTDIIEAVLEEQEKVLPEGVGLVYMFPNREDDDEFFVYRVEKKI